MVYSYYKYKGAFMAKELTAADVWAIIAETGKQIAANSADIKKEAEERKALRRELNAFIKASKEESEERRASFREFRASFGELRASIKEDAEERKASFGELRASFRELRASIKEDAEERKASVRELKALNKEAVEERKAMAKELNAQIKKVDEQLGGIGQSNGDWTEEYFQNALEAKLEFAGQHYDVMEKNFSRSNKDLKDEYDIAMFNGTSVAIIEIKYKVKIRDLKKMVTKKVPNFRALYPEYANHDLYLGIGSLSIAQNIFKKAEELGIGLLRQKGDTIEVETSFVKPY
jgi:chromosome segregation ATPase